MDQVHEFARTPQRGPRRERAAEAMERTGAAAARCAGLVSGSSSTRSEIVAGLLHLIWGSEERTVGDPAVVEPFDKDQKK